MCQQRVFVVRVPDGTGEQLADRARWPVSLIGGVSRMRLPYFFR
jgi:hypothetical protein